MRNSIRKIFIAVFAVAVIFLFGAGSIYIFFRLLDPVGYRNSKICPTLKAGISITELKKMLGEPISKDKIKGKIWLSFQTPSLQAGPISAEIDESTDQVLTLRCNEDGPSTWSINPK
jgi:hypothetical protein